ncbi:MULTISPECIES: glutathione S-transferase N-terminal domain-containing protein [unclassified Caulobacter]|uniref:glutathione S-transferase N-terminal domain-containing protein n=1 Tax=unclassified Caulobacter TaxID=2648921 RepID=UPI0006F9BF2B|nr:MULTISPECIES: glutathione S-transferase N-terminal domain-containing protein [unclassified Caulobacter]KQV62051.1 glutathione S-transferase [Caulobacter sp. Root342]KQV64737.1 glutathione S-transferase [Caulobacter sp. Root343]
MIDLYTWTTPNGRKASIMLEEVGLPYRVHPVDLSKDQQFEPNFLAISPNNKIPAIVDHDAPGGPQAIFESGAILVYLAEKTGRFLAPEGSERWAALEWTFWQVGGLGPMAGQYGYFAMRAEEKIPAAIQRFGGEVARLLGVLDRRLNDHPWIAGEHYSIADIASYSWTKAVLAAMGRAEPDRDAGVPAVENWLMAMEARPAVQQGMAVPKV